MEVVEEPLRNNMNDQGLTNPVLPGQLGNPGTSGGDVIARFIPAAISIGLLIGTLIFFIYLIWGSIDWIASGGDKQKLESARGKITNAILGLVILFATFAILNLIGFFFHIEILTGLNFSSLQIQP